MKTEFQPCYKENEMVPLIDTARTQKEELKEWVRFMHGTGVNDVLSKSDFLRDSFEALASLVHHNKHNSLIQDAVRQYPDLIPRGFTILSVLHGVYTTEPTKKAVMRDFVNLLDEDLIEKELMVCTYARSNKTGAFFPQLVHVLDTIRDIYDAEYFSLQVLPPTSHQAYVLYVLNCADLLCKKVSKEEIFGNLAVCHARLNKVIDLSTRHE